MSKPLIFLAGFALGATVVFVLDRSEILWRKKPIVNQEPKPKDNAEESPEKEPRVVFCHEDVFEDEQGGAESPIEVIPVDGIPDDLIEDEKPPEPISLSTLLDTNISGEGTTGNNTENNEQQK